MYFTATVPTRRAGGSCSPRQPGRGRFSPDPLKRALGRAVTAPEGRPRTLEANPVQAPAGDHSAAVGPRSCNISNTALRFHILPCSTTPEADRAAFPSASVNISSIEHDATQRLSLSRYQPASAAKPQREVHPSGHTSSTSHHHCHRRYPTTTNHQPRRRSIFSSIHHENTIALTVARRF